MKSLKDYSLNLDESTYHSYDAWSYSKIAKYAKDGFSAIANMDKPTSPTPSMEFGSLFDAMITRAEEVTSLYQIVDDDVPPSEKAVIEYLARANEAKTLSEISDVQLQTAFELCKYHTNWKFDTCKQKLLNYQDYYRILKSGKKLISKEDWDDAYEMYHAFQYSPYLNDLFGKRSTDKVEYLYQTQYAVPYTLPSGKTVRVKIMPDLIKVNHEDKTIQLVDLKTSSDPAWNFQDNFIKFAYYIQAKLYSDVIEIIKDRDADLQEYYILPYLFTDISRTDKIPVTYTYDQNAESQRNGFSFSKGDKVYSYKSWQTLLDEILSYKEIDAKVPAHIKLEEANNLLDILNLSMKQ